MSEGLYTVTLSGATPETAQQTIGIDNVTPSAYSITVYGKVYSDVVTLQQGLNPDTNNNISIISQQMDVNVISRQNNKHMISPPSLRISLIKSILE